MDKNLFSQIITEYTELEGTEAIGLGGSSSAKTDDGSSDIDIYIFSSKDIPLAKREKIVLKYSSKYEIGGEYFGPGDEYYVDKLDKQLDIMFWNKNWFEQTVDNIWFKHYPSNGYTTCFLYTLSNLKVLYDPQGWLRSMKNKINTPYPKELKENIIKRNIMLLKDKPFASYYEQISKAIIRKDIVSINHRIAAFLASYFDIIFARNELLHPGEKRLINYAKTNCKILPKNFERNLHILLEKPKHNTLRTLEQIIENLREIL